MEYILLYLTHFPQQRLLRQNTVFEGEYELGLKRLCGNRVLSAAPFQMQGEKRVDKMLNALRLKSTVLGLELGSTRIKAVF